MSDAREFQAKKEILTRLLAAGKEIDEIQKVTHTPSISYGILHNGEVLFRDSIGIRDVETKLPANSDTIYPLASVSKGFLSALVGIAVAEGKLSWTATISTYLPDFDPIDDPDVGKKARILDCLRHSAGIPTHHSLVIGPTGHLVSKEEDFIKLVNTSPSKDPEGKARYDTWVYSNWGYGIVALCLQKVYGIKYHQLLQQKILDPIGLKSTLIRDKDVDATENVAKSTVRLEDGSLVHVASRETTEEHAAMLSVLGIRSSVNDMLKWAKVLLAAERVERETKPRQMPNYPSNNPLRHVSTTRGKAYWTRPNHDEFGNDIQYCLGWLRVIMPSSGLGSIGLNMRSRKNPVPKEWIIGAESPKMEVIIHGGIGMGSSCMFYTFPESRSAIMVFSNTIQDVCAADFTAQVLTEALFGLKPHVDILPFVKNEIEKKKAEGYEKLIREWKEHRDVSGEEQPMGEYVGDYKCGVTMLSVKLENSLIVTFGGVNETERELEWYGKDAYSCFPLTKDAWLTETLHCWGWETGILRFQRNEGGVVDGLMWKYSSEELPMTLMRV